MRESPAISICEGLVKRGAHLRLWDPAAMQEAVWRLKSIEKFIVFASNEYNAIEGSHALVLVTEWNQFRNLDLIKVNKLLLSPYFFFFWNIYNKDEVTAAGLHYFGVGTYLYSKIN
jgi:UDPglucose 6-dehydrogenase